MWREMSRTIAPVDHRYAAHVDRNSVTVAVHDPALGFEEIARDHRRHQLAQVLPALRRHEGMWRRMHHLGHRTADQGREGRIDIDDAPVPGEQQQAIGGSIEDRAILLLARAQRIFGELALGDVAREGEHPRLAADQGALEPHLVPAQAAVGTAAVPIERDRAVALGALDPLHCLLVRVQGLSGADRAH
jgi:hypothetical protein